METILLILAFAVLRRAHGSKFYGLIENNTLKRLVCTVLMAGICIAYSMVYQWYGLILIPLFWLWLAPGTYLDGVNGNEEETALAVLREFYVTVPAIAIMPHILWQSIACYDGSFCSGYGLFLLADAQSIRR